MSQKLLKIKLYQPFANFRKPFSYGIVDSYPLPPPSTVKGWLHNILGQKMENITKWLFLFVESLIPSFMTFKES